MTVQLMFINVQAERNKLARAQKGKKKIVARKAAATICIVQASQFAGVCRWQQPVVREIVNTSGRVRASRTQGARWQNNSITMFQ